jgi:hypothetical protein
MKSSLPAWLLIAAFLPATASGVVPAAKPERDQTVTLQVDLDDDGKPDKVTAHYRWTQQLFWVNIELSRGRKFTPLSGRVDPARARLSLSYRGPDAPGDKRCAEWRPAKRPVTCGAVQSSGDAWQYLAVDTGTQMFLLTYSEARGELSTPPYDHEHAYFRVMPAIEGPVSAR